MKRRVTLKVDSALASKILEELELTEGEISIEVEDSGATYKRLSKIEGVLDWEFEDEKKEVEQKRGVECGGSTEDASILFEALYALKLSHPKRSFESLSEEDLEEQIQFISNSDTSFNHLAIKVVLEKEYNNPEEAKEKILEIFKNKWDTVLNYGTALGFLFNLYGKKK